ncbi:hypothetical protein M9458_010445, partial [Cirrhinus mrigala]
MCRESASAALVKDQGALRITVRDAPPGNPPRKSCPSKRGPVELLKHDTHSSRGEPSVSFGAPEEDRMSVALEEGLPSAEADDSAEQSSTAGAAQSEADAEVAAMLLRAAKGIGVEVFKAPSPEPSQLDDDPPHPAPVYFFQEVHEELTKTWGAPYTASSCLSSSLSATLDGGAARGYVDVPRVEHVVA